jgi:uncharacterized BrkB/YihY/UPF0761 family membrane protein
VVITALKWPFRAALFPVIIGSLVFLMSAAELFLNLLGGENGGEEASGFDFKLTELGDQGLVRRRTLSMFVSILVFFFLVLLVGFHVSIPIFFFLFLKFKAKEKWRISLGLTALAWVSFYGLFIWLLHIDFPQGWIQRWLGTIGIGL